MGGEGFWEPVHLGCLQLCVPSSVLGKPPQPDSLRPETLVRVTVGGLTLTVPHQGPAPAPPLPAQDFFTELDSCKDAAFGGRDFSPLRQTFERACPHSHLRYCAVLPPMLTCL